MVPPLDLPAPILRVPGTAFWVLRNDEAIAPQVNGGSRLDWDRFMFEFAPVRAVLDKGPEAVAVDVGAFIGDSAWAFYAAGARVLAFEPQADAFVCLRHNLPGAACYCAAVGDGSKVTLQVGEGGNMGARRTFPAPTGLPTLRLDDVPLPDGRLDFLKIDVEGFEPFVLDGAWRTINHHRPVIWMEVNDAALADHGFKGRDLMDRLPAYEFVVTQPLRVGTEHPYDLLCVPQ